MTFGFLSTGRYSEIGSLRRSLPSSISISTATPVIGLVIEWMLTFVLVALATWYGIPWLAAEARAERTMEDKEQSIETQIIQALTELRVILPGAQALFGFQFSVVLIVSRLSCQTRGSGPGCRRRNK